MLNLASQSQVRRFDLIIRPLGEEGPFVVKAPQSGEFFQIGAEEHFLLLQVDGAKDADAIRASFEEHFGQPLTEEELDEFIQMAQHQGLLEPAAGFTTKQEQTAPVAHKAQPSGMGSQRAGERSCPHQSILYWRKALFDPDRFLNFLESRLRFFWTRGFLLFSALSIAAALVLVWTSGEQMASSFSSVLRWETALWVWLILFLVTMLHEFAHGLTCKHYGGEVHEIGFLMMFFMPCFYCNVSDAWLFPEKSKRLWVTFNGGYFELFLWALAVFIWRLTVPDSMVHYLAFMVVVSCGVQTLFNYNPLLKLDGYYLLSDWLEIPNLRRHALEYFHSHCRWILWGAIRPEREVRGRVLLLYGLVGFTFSLFFLSVMLWSLADFANHYLGWMGLVPVTMLGVAAGGNLFHGFTKGEVQEMLLLRHKRLVCWLLILAGITALLTLVPIEDRASGEMKIRCYLRSEIRAPVAGFLKEILCEEGDRISYSTVLFRLEIPDLDSRLTQKRAEVKETEAKLQLLLIGPRPEEIREQRERVKRMAKRLALAEAHLQRQQQAFEQESKRLQYKIAEYRTEAEAAEKTYHRATLLRRSNALAEEDYSKAKRNWQVTQAQLQQAQEEKKAQQARGTLAAEQDIAERGKELAEATATLTLLLAGSRPEEIQAQRAALARLQAEVRYLEQLHEKLEIAAPISGAVMTPHLREKIGQYVREGDLIAVVEELSALEVEISLDEQDAAALRLDQQVSLRVRAFPFETFSAKVQHLSPCVHTEEKKKVVVVGCLLENPRGELQPGMTGYGKVYTGPRVIGAIVLHRVLRYMRTEFWW